MKTSLYALSAMVCLCACSNEKSTDTQADMTVDGNIITLPANSNILSYLKTDTVALHPYSPEFTTSGEARAIPSQFAEVSVPYSGRIIKTFVTLGQTVAKGTPLFQISSSDYYEISRAFMDARHELELSERMLARKQHLFDNKIASKSDLEEAQTDFNLKKQAYDQAAASLKIFGATPEDIKSGEPLTVKAPIAGKVVADKIVLGQYVKDDAEPLIQIADLSKMWVIANVKEKDLPLVNHLKDVEISFVALPDTTYQGHIYHVNDILEPESRSIEVIIECDNASGELKPNLYATVALTDEPMQAIVVPASAVLQEEDFTYVIKVIGERQFEKAAVTVASSTNSNSVITSGLQPGDVIVSKGSFYFIESN